LYSTRQDKPNLAAATRSVNTAAPMLINNSRFPGSATGILRV
jgi:hypothetical protein